MPTLYELHAGAKQDPQVRQSIFSYPAEWQRTFILNPNAPTDTQEYVLMDADKNQAVLQPSDKPRSLNPVKVYREGDRNMVVANVFDVPFPLKGGRYNPEDLDQTTGFPKQLDPKGQYGIWFGSDSRLYAVFLFGYGVAHCRWGPSDSHGSVGLRGRSTGNQGSEILFESEVDVLQARLENLEKERRDERVALLGEIDRVEAHYVDGLQQLRALKEKLNRK